jgi:hypothetical protein
MTFLPFRVTNLEELGLEIIRRHPDTIVLDPEAVLLLVQEDPHIAGISVPRIRNGLAKYGGEVAIEVSAEVL